MPAVGVHRGRDVGPIMGKRVTQKIPFLDIASQQAEIAAEVLPVWKAQFASAGFIGGPEVKAFEEEYADYIGVGHVVGVSNGTDALELAFRAVGVGAGDEVIMPANTFIATAEAASRIGAVPVFVDVDPDYLLIDPEAVEAAITPRTRAIVPVHLYGQTAPVERILPIADAHGIVVVEDAAQSQGASSIAGRAGALGRVAGDELLPGQEPRCRRRRRGGHDERPRHRCVRPGHRGPRQLGEVRPRSHRHELAAGRRAGARAAGQAAPPRRVERRPPRRRRSIPRAARRHRGRAGSGRARRQRGRLAPLRRAGRRARPRAGRAGGRWRRCRDPLSDTGPPHRRVRAASGYRRGQFPVAEAAADRILSLPMFPHLTADQQEFVVAAVQTAVGATRDERAGR